MGTCRGGNRRPYAIQFSNFKTVEITGIGQADIVYEALVEGGITRFLAIGENFTGDRIGSIRSSRHYFASFADEYDAIYIHYGKTKYAVTKLKNLGLNNLDGETGIGTTVFYRDKSMSAPHNAFTSLDRILAGIDKKGYETEHSQDFEAHYSFFEEDTDLLTGLSAIKYLLSTRITNHILSTTKRTSNTYGISSVRFIRIQTQMSSLPLKILSFSLLRNGT